jgi:hypothetical protein
MLTMEIINNVVAQFIKIFLRMYAIYKYLIIFLYNNFQIFLQSIDD